MSVKKLYEWWKAQTLENSQRMVEMLTEDARNHRKDVAARLVDDLTVANTLMDFRTDHFKFRARVVHAEQWESQDPAGEVWVRFTLETVGAPQETEPKPESGWKE